MTRKEIKNRCKDVYLTWDAFESELNKLLDSGAVDVDKITDNSYKDIYPIVAAIMVRDARRCIYGNSTEERNREAKRKNEPISQIHLK